MAAKAKLGDSHMVPLESIDLAWLPDFQPDDWPDITKAYTLYLDWWFCTPMKLVLDGEIIGVGNVVRFQYSAWLSQIIIKPSHQNQGYGTAFTEALIALVNDRVSSISLLATDMGFPIYKKLGFQTQGQYSFYKYDMMSVESPSIDLEAYATEYHCAMLDFDKKVTGEYRARLLQNYLPESKMVLENNKLVALSIPQLGDGWMISRSAEIGIELMKIHIQAKRKITIPDENMVAQNYLLSLGINPYRKAYRMVLGKPFEYKPEYIYGRIGGNLG